MEKRLGNVARRSFLVLTNLLVQISSSSKASSFLWTDAKSLVESKTWRLFKSVPRPALDCFVNLNNFAQRPTAVDKSVVVQKLSPWFAGRSSAQKDGGRFLGLRMKLFHRGNCWMPALRQVHW